MSGTGYRQDWANESPSWAQTSKDIPDEEHFAIIEFGSIWVPGDERSRTAPGHGYPDHTETKVDYITFPSRAAWEAEIKKRTADGTRRETWVPIQAKRAKIVTKVEVDIK